jgi:small subunit ribosomal protein S19e
VAAVTSVYDVPADKLIEEAAKRLQALPEMKPPEWAPFVKTGVHREKPPVRKDWWHVRTAAVLRKVYLKGPIGTERLAALFGGNVDGGSAPKHPRQSSRNIIRKGLQQLKAAGFIADEPKNRGKIVTAKGQSFLDNASYVVWKDLAAKNPELAKYH